MRRLRFWVFIVALAIWGMTTPLEAQWMTKRQRVADRAGFLDGRDDNHLAQTRQTLGERRHALRSIAIVVCDEDARHW